MKTVSLILALSLGIIYSQNSSLKGKVKNICEYSGEARTVNGRIKMWKKPTQQYHFEYYNDRGYMDSIGSGYRHKYKHTRCKFHYRNDTLNSITLWTIDTIESRTTYVDYPDRHLNTAWEEEFRHSTKKKADHFYNEKNQMIKNINYDEQGSLEYRIDYVHDSIGNIIQTTHYNSMDSMIAQYNSIYGSQNEVITAIHNICTGPHPGTYIYTYFYTFDKQGNWIRKMQDRGNGFYYVTERKIEYYKE